MLVSVFCGRCQRMSTEKLWTRTSRSPTTRAPVKGCVCVCPRSFAYIRLCVGLIDLVFVSFNRREAIIGFSKDVTSWKWQCLLTLGSSILLLEIKTKERNRGRLTTNWAKQSRKELTETAFVYLKCVCVCVIMIKANVIERPLGFKLPEFQFDQTPTWLHVLFSAHFIWNPRL